MYIIQYICIIKTLLDTYTFFALFIINSIEIILYISKVEFN